MNDFALSLVRTWVPIGAGAVLSWLAVHFGVVVDADTEAQLAVVLTAVVTAAYYALVRALEKKWPAFGKLLGSKQKPVYVPPTR